MGRLLCESEGRKGVPPPRQYVSHCRRGHAAGVTVESDRRHCRTRLLLGFLEITKPWLPRQHSLPCQSGEAIKIVAIRNFTKISGGSAIASALLDRVSDVLAVGLFFLIALAKADLGAFSAVQALTAFAFFSAVAVAVVALFYQTERMERITGKCLLLCPSPLRDPLNIWHRQAFAFVKTLDDPLRAGTVALISILALFFDSLSLFCATLAFGWSLPISSGVVIAVFIALATILPSAPGYVGVYQVAAVLALGIFNIAASPAIAYSVVVQLLALIVLGLQGGIIGLVAVMKRTTRQDLLETNVLSIPDERLNERQHS